MNTVKGHWAAIPGYEGLYEASRDGQIRSLDRITVQSDGKKHPYRGRVLRQTASKVDGRPYVNLSKAGSRRVARVPRLVAAAFYGPTPDGMMVLHNNGDAGDNRIENLRYGTASDNMIDKIRHGHNHQVEKPHCPRGHLLVEPNLVKGTAARGQRACDSCHKAWHASRRPGRTVALDTLAGRIYPIVMAGAWPVGIGPTKKLMAELIAAC